MMPSKEHQFEAIRPRREKMFQQPTLQFLALQLFHLEARHGNREEAFEG